MKRLLKRLLAVGALVLAGPGGAFAQDGFNLSSAAIRLSPEQDIASWTQTVQITGVTINTVGNGIGIQTAAPIPWPNTILPGFTGPLQYTVWVCVTPAAWQCVGVVQMWQGRNVPPDGSLPPLPSGFNLWWGANASATSGAFGNYVPQPGDTIGLFIAAGDLRAGDGGVTVKERSNVVTFQLAAGDTQSLTFSGTPPVVPPVPPPPSDDLNGIIQQLHDAVNRIGTLETAVAKLQVEADGATSDLAIVGGRLATLEGDVTTLQSRTIPMSCSASVFGVPIHCALK